MSVFFYEITHKNLVNYFQARPPKKEEQKDSAPTVTMNASAAATTTAPATTTTTAPATNTSEPTTTAPTNTNTNTTTTTSTTQPVQPTASTALPEGVTEDAVGMLVAASGKPREMVIQALAMAQGNGDLAFTILLEGIPMGGQGGGGMPGMGGMEADYGDEEASYDQADGGQGMAGAAAFAELAQNPQFQRIAQRMRENPQFYQEFIQQLQTQNPALWEAIQQNPMMFMNLVMSGNPMAGMGGAGGMGAGMMGGARPAGGQPRAQ